jgi:hypothetical protein
MLQWRRVRNKINTPCNLVSSDWKLKRQSCPCKRPWRPITLWDVVASVVKADKSGLQMWLLSQSVFILLGVSRIRRYRHHHCRSTGTFRVRGNLPVGVPVFSSPLIQVHDFFLDPHEKESISNFFINLLSILLTVKFSELSVNVKYCGRQCIGFERLICSFCSKQALVV